MSTDNVKSPGYYAIIPANVRYAKIPDGAKLLYGEITTLCNKKGYCWASNQYFAELYGKDRDTITRWLKALRVRHFIFIKANKSEGNQRTIHLFNPEAPYP